MRIRIAILLLVCSIGTALYAHTYEDSSVLGAGNFVKIQVTSTGIYRLTYEQLKEMGLNPRDVRLLGYGGNLLPQNFTLPHTDDVPSIPFYMHKGTDNEFSAGDYILFYAQGPVGWDWTGAYFSRTRNCYADFGCYFLSDNAGQQLLMQESEPLVADSPHDVYTYTALQLHEKDQINLLDVANGKEGGGREWYGEILTANSSQLSIPFTFNDPDPSQRLVCYLNAAANSTESSTFQLNVAGATQTCYVNPVEVSDFYSMAKEGTIRLTNTYPTSSSLPVKITYKGAASAAGYINYVEMQVPCFLNLRGNSLFIRNTEHIGSPIPSCYHLTGADASTLIWNLTNPQHATLMPTWWQGDTLCWLGSNESIQLFCAVRMNGSGFASPASRGKVSNQNLHRDLRGKQHVIITPEPFRYAAEELKRAHEQQTPDQHWAVVTDEEVFNEFSSGTPDGSAFRWMMKYLYDTFKDTDNAPRSLLLFGDGSFDNRQLLKTSPVPTLLTYEAHNSMVETYAYATDDYFAFLEDNDGNYGSKWSDQRARMRISVGRLPVNTCEEAEQVVRKLCTFMQNAGPGKWKQQICFLADDGDSGLHMTTADVAAELVRNGAPDYIINKIYLDAYIQESSASGESYPLAYNRFSNMLQTGVAFMDFAGHGSPNNICSEMFLTLKQVQGMANANQGVWALATCNFARFDQKEQSTAEAAVLNPIGGAIAVISSDRTVYASENEILNKYFCQNLFAHTDPFTYPNTIGEALRLAKNLNGDNMNKMPFVLLGDPALRLNYPSQYQVRISTMPGTLHALDLVSLSGYISNGDTLTNPNKRDTVSFNGQVSLTVFDKQQIVSTHDNDQPDESKKVIRQFRDYPNKLFVGEADVKNGHFTFQFRMPKDIRYNLGNGRMAFYAVGEDEKGQAEAIGHNENFKVGGSTSLTIDDNEGPDIHMYLNTPLFQNGDCVNSTPHFFAELYDRNGINTVGSGIGHDLLMVVDNNNKQTYVLNDYFTAENNSYQRGLTSYVMPELADGSHSLSFRAWDLVNNASTKTLHFTVNHEQGPVVKKMIVYPNPVAQFGTLHLVLQNDRPDDRLSIELCFYDMVGHKVWSTEQAISDENITLSMANTSMPPGVYIYQFTIRTTTQSSEKYNGRLIVY